MRDPQISPVVKAEAIIDSNRCWDTRGLGIIPTSFKIMVWKARFTLQIYTKFSGYEESHIPPV